LQKNFI